MKRSSIEIKKKILEVLSKESSSTYAELERKVNTSYQSIVANCKELESFAFITILKLNKHPATGRPYFKVQATTQGREILKKL